jgi:hypothetical protein
VNERNLEMMFTNVGKKLWKKAATTEEENTEVETTGVETTEVETTEEENTAVETTGVETMEGGRIMDHIR